MKKKSQGRFSRDPVQRNASVNEGRSYLWKDLGSLAREGEISRETVDPVKYRGGVLPPASWKRTKVRC